MKNMINQSIRGFFDKICIIYFFVFTCILSYELDRNKFDLSHDMYSLLMIEYHHFFCIITVLFFCYKMISMYYKRKDVQLIRYVKMSKFLSKQLMSGYIVSIIFVLLHVILIFIVTYIGIKNSFFCESENNDIQRIVACQITTYGGSVGLTFALSAMYMILGFTFISALCLMIITVLGKKGAVLIYAYAFLSIIRDNNSVLKLIKPRNFIIFVCSIDNLCIYIILMIVLIPVMWMISSKLWMLSENIRIPRLRKKKDKPLTINRWFKMNIYTKKNVLLIMCALALKCIYTYIYINVDKHVDFNEFMLFIMYGPVGNGFSIIDFINVAVNSLVIFYVICSVYQTINSVRNTIVFIRFRNKRDWIKRLYIKLAKVIITYNIFSMCLFVTCAIVVSKADSLDCGNSEILKNVMIDYGKYGIIFFIVRFVILRTLGMLISLNIVFIVDSYFSNIFIAFTIILVLNFLTIFDIPCLCFNPIGMEFIERQLVLCKYADFRVGYLYIIELVFYILSSVYFFVGRQHSFSVKSS